MFAGSGDLSVPILDESFLIRRNRKVACAESSSHFVEFYVKELLSYWVKHEEHKSDQCPSKLTRLDVKYVN